MRTDVSGKIIKTYYEINKNEIIEKAKIFNYNHNRRQRNSKNLVDNPMK